MVSRISILFRHSHQARLKNIFHYYFNDELFWQQIEALITANLVNFHPFFIYEKDDFSYTSILSIILLEIYFFDFDYFIREVSFRFSSNKNLFLKNIESLKLRSNYSFLHCILPLKLERVLFQTCKLKRYKFVKIKLAKFSIHNFIFESYVRNYFASRYKDKFFLGFLSSRKYFLFIKNKLAAFLRSVLEFDIVESYCLFPPSTIFILGFELGSVLFHKRLISPLFKLDSTIQKAFDFKTKILSRVGFLKSKFVQLFFSRIRYELIANFLINKSSSGFLKTPTLDYKFWSYLFQLESLRSFRYYRLLLTDDVFISFPNNIPMNINLKNLYRYKNYYFSIYLNRFSLSFLRFLNYYRSNLLKSLLPLDLFSGETLFDISKSLDLNYSLFFNYSMEKKFFFNNKIGIKFSVTLNDNKKSLGGFYIFAPLRYIYQKFKFLGFIHPFKNRPVGNSRFLSLADNQIVMRFLSTYVSIILWYSDVDNFGKLISFVKVLKESCLLTLSRKHNKSKVWVKSIFGSTIFVANNLYKSSHYFNFLGNLENLNSAFNLNEGIILVEEQFFLNF